MRTCSAQVYPAALFWLELELARAAFSLLTAGGDAGSATWLDGCVKSNRGMLQKTKI